MSAAQPEESVSVAVPLPVQGPFDYSLPPGMAAPGRGCRVRVPFGPRKLVGVVTTRHSGDPPAGALKPILDVLDERPLVSESLLDLAEFVSDHYLAPIGECYRLVLPFHGLARRGKTTAAREVQRAVLVTDGGEPPGKPPGAAQARVLAALRSAGGSMSVADLARDDSAARGALQRLAAKGLVRLESERVMRSPAVLAGEGKAPFTATAEQLQAVEAIAAGLASNAFAPFLLHGVTGSGKTEVYFRAAELALAAGRGVLILVPEIALTPFLVRAAKHRFGDSVAVLHSELSMGERYDQWWMIREGQSRVVVGARSAVFAPIPNLGLICVDEEHESAYKQEENPRYHGRDLAVARAQMEKAVVVLGSATPSVESYDNAAKGKYTETHTQAARRRLGPAGSVDRGPPCRGEGW